MINKPNSNLFEILDSIDSTNNYAMAEVHAGLAKHGMAWIAKLQTAGKGQRGKKWTGEPGQNIAMSLVVEPFGLPVTALFGLSTAVALGCWDFFSKYVDEKLTIKWPNDLYWADRKAGGVLIENVLKGENWQWAVIGIGININQTLFSEELKAVSLSQITGKLYDVVVLAKELYNCVMNRVEAILSNGNFLSYLAEYNEYLFKRGEKVLLKKGNIRLETFIKEINAYGQLVTEDNIERVFNWGEVEWISG